MIEELLRQGHDITVATRQNMKDNFGDKINRIKIERTDPTLKLSEGLLRLSQEGDNVLKDILCHVKI